MYRAMQRATFGLAAALALAWLPVVPCAGAAARRAPSAQAFVAGIYAEHVGPNEGFGLDTRADYLRYFEPVLARAMFRDDVAAWERKDVARLNVDRFVDATSCRISGIKVAVAHVAPARAVATVTFDNAGVLSVIRLDLVRLAIGWRIHDIHAPSGDLRARLVTR